MKIRAVCVAALALYLVSLAGFGCTASDSAVNSTSAGTEDAGPDVEDTGGEDANLCRQSETICDGTCVRTDYDPHNCGSCGNACAEGQVCNNGTCDVTCGPGLVECNEKCVDPDNDRSYCGASGDCEGVNSGTACADGEVCSSGTCAVNCQQGQINCEGTCIDPSTDRSWCGASSDCVGDNSGTACADGEVCSNGACDLSCPAELVECDGSCINPDTDRTYCGASDDCEGDRAGAVCEDGEVCASGACDLSCPSHLVECNGTCIDPDTDRAYCGASGDCQDTNSGSACASGEVCNAGACELSCQQGQINCDGTCIDPDTDRAYCGASGDCQGPNAGQSCSSGEVCSNGSCALSCPANLVECDGTCIDPDTDRAYCGASGDCQDPNAGQSCSSGEICASGSCQLSCPSGQIACDGSCIDPDTDRAYCGASGDCQGPNAGASCSSGEICTSGSCQLSCQPGLTDCGGVCTDTSSDDQNCGSCGNSCPTGASCDSGQCTGFFPNSVLLNDSQQSQINTWVGDASQTWSLCYRRSTHGASSSIFHSRCDGQGPTVTVAELSNGTLMGGYASQSWLSRGTYFGDSDSFLFSLTNSYKHSYPGQSSGSYWMYDRSSYGPTFGGGHDWHVNGSISGGYCNIGFTYECRTGSYGSSTCRNDFCGSYSSWTINELEVWVRD